MEEVEIGTRPRELFCPLARGRCEREACVMYWDNKDPTAKPRCQYFKTEIPRE